MRLVPVILADVKHGQFRGGAPVTIVRLEVAGYDHLLRSRVLTRTALVQN